MAILRISDTIASPRTRITQLGTNCGRRTSRRASKTKRSKRLRGVPTNGRLNREISIAFLLTERLLRRWKNQRLLWVIRRELRLGHLKKMLLLISRKRTLVIIFPQIRLLLVHKHSWPLSKKKLEDNHLPWLQHKKKIIIGRLESIKKILRRDLNLQSKRWNLILLEKTIRDPQDGFLTLPSQPILESQPSILTVWQI